MSSQKSPFSIRQFLGFKRTVDTVKEETLPASYFESVSVDSGFGFDGGSLNVGQIKSALEDGRFGMTAQQVAMLEEVLEREGQAAAHLQTRSMAVSGKGWNVTSRNHPEIALEAQKMLSSADLQQLIIHLTTQVLYGYAGAVIDWQEGGRRINGFRQIRPSAFLFDTTGIPSILDADGNPHPLHGFAPGQFVFATGRGGCGMPSKNGVGRTLLWLYLMKKVGIGGWVRFIEKFGMPMMLGKLPSTANRNQVNELLAALQRMARDGIGVSVGEQSGIETVECAKNGGDHASFCRYVDEIITLVILGQLATSDSASGLSNGDIQGRVRQDLVASDASLIINAIQNQVLNPWLRLAYGLDPKDHDITFWIDFAPSEDLNLKAELCLKVVNATGCKLDRAWAEEQFGVRLSDTPLPLN